MARLVSRSVRMDISRVSTIARYVLPGVPLVKALLKLVLRVRLGTIFTRISAFLSVQP